MASKLDTMGDVPEIAPFDPSKKKKKKKNTTLDVTNENADPLAEKTLNLSLTDGQVDATGQEEPSCAANSQDYLYEELLGRVFTVLHQCNPGLAGGRQRTVLRPPIVERHGKKTFFRNFVDLCKMMHRQPDHVMAFVLAELATSGSVDGQQQLVIKGMFFLKHIEKILRSYMNEYVICDGCKSSDTMLAKENRLSFLRCQQCCSSRSVSAIDVGFVAQGRRVKA